MKKIVSAAAIAAMTAGIASADITIKASSQLRGTVFSNKSSDGASGKDNKVSKWATLANGDFTESDVHALTFAAKGEKVGFNLKMEVCPEGRTIKDANTTYTLDTTDASSHKLVEKDSTKNIDNNYIDFNSGYAFVNPVDGLTLTIGRLETRSVNAVTNDAKSFSLLGANVGKKIVVKTNKTDAVTVTKVEAAKKLGFNPNIAKVNEGKVGVDVTCITDNSGSKTTSFTADYKLTGLAGDDDTLQFWGTARHKLAAFDDMDSKDEKTVGADSQFAVQAQYTMPKTVQFTAIGQFYANNSYAFAGFVSPLMLDGLTSTIGFTYAADGKTPATDDTYKYMAIDARFRYAITDQLSASLFMNYSNWNLGDADTLKGAILDTQCNVRYAVNDTVSVFGEAEFVAHLYKDSSMKDARGNDLVVQAGADVTLAKGATLSTGVVSTFSGLGADVSDLYGSTISIPLYLVFSF